MVILDQMAIFDYIGHFGLSDHFWPHGFFDQKVILPHMVIFDPEVNFHKTVVFDHFRLFSNYDVLTQW